MSLHWDQLPSWQRDNQYILSGYRTASNSFRRSFAGLAYVHNESVNIYSHLVPAILLLFISLTLHASLTARYASVPAADTIALGCFVLGAVLCLVISATFHTVQNHSSHVARIANQMNYIGIVFLIVGRFIPSIFYGFYCHPILQTLYISMVCPHFSSIFRVLEDAYEPNKWKTVLGFLAGNDRVKCPTTYTLKGTICTRIAIVSLKHRLFC